MPNLPFLRVIRFNCEDFGNGEISAMLCYVYGWTELSLIV